MVCVILIIQQLVISILTRERYKILSILETQLISLSKSEEKIFESRSNTYICTDATALPRGSVRFLRRDVSVGRTVIQNYINMFGIFSSDDTNPLEQMDARDLRLEAESVSTDMKLKENELQELEQNFKSKIQDAADAGPEEGRLKAEAASIKTNYEQKEAAYQADLKEYTTLRTLQNAKERVNSQNGSVLRNMDADEMQSFRKDMKRTILEETDKVERLGEIGDTIDETLTAISPVSDTETSNEIDTLVNMAKNGDDLSEFSLSEESKTKSSSSTEFEGLR